MPPSSQALSPVAALDLALTTITPYQRPDLAHRLGQARSRLTDGRVRVLVVGEFKQGKSLLVNGVVSAPVCPVYDDVATLVPTVVHAATTARATLVRLPSGEENAGGPAGSSSTDGADDFDPAAMERVVVPIEELAPHICEAGNPGNAQRWHHAEIGIPRGVLAGGLELVDTPGVGGLNSVHGAATMAALGSADAVLLVSDSSAEYSATELEFLRQATGVCPNVACVLTKTDVYPDWRRIAELDRRHLATAGIDARLLTVSSTLRIASIETSDPELDSESGFPALISYLRNQVVGQADVLARRSTVHDVMAVTEQLAAMLRAEQAAHADPESAQAVITELTAAQQRSAALKERSARWQHTLNDGVADLNADIEYDLRDRMREITREAEEEVDNGGDPHKIWDQLSSWVEQEAASAAAANHLWTTTRARWLADQVAEHFGADGAELLPKLRTQTGDALEYVRDMQLREGEKFGIAQKGLSGLRGSYVGVLMFGMLGTVVGLPLINPFSLGAGLLLGGKGVADDRRRILTRRQAEAKTAVRRYIDDVIFQVGKESRDMLRRVQRDLRDHFTARAEELNRSLKSSLSSAQRSVTLSESERTRRLAEIPGELDTLEQLQRTVSVLVTEDDTVIDVGTSPPGDTPPPPATLRPLAPAQT